MILALLIPPLALLACPGGSTKDPADTGTDTGAPDTGGTDTGIDTGTETDTGIDTGTDTDTDTDTDTGTFTESLYTPPQSCPSVTVVDSEIYDAARDRTFAVRVRIPDGAPEPLAAVVFSHGGGSDDNGHTGYVDMGEFLSGACYVVIHIAHAVNEFDAHCGPLGIPAEECTYEIFDAGAEVADGGTLGVGWYDRPLDGGAVLDAIPTFERLSGLDIDEARIGLVGHSGGAHTVMSSAGAKVDYSPTVRQVTLPEPRYAAYVALSPQGIGRLGMNGTSWEDIRVPLMIGTGANDRTYNELPEDHLHSWDALSGPDAWLAYIDDPGATHDVIGLYSTPGMGGLEPYIASPILAFLDAYLRDSADARAWLERDALRAASDNVAWVEQK